ncbi:hypothetical protein predicted by Glimmer/Critica [Acetobacter ghanensis]|uniref:Uncharacterized protein n=1 Tax=Acetobacter ghanensis TaxID=431306 RepID=A0A0U5F533_9PROT|nr:hypothetical protein predicted by Glimmer/Critica [Acetobacter ghanensis]
MACPAILTIALANMIDHLQTQVMYCDQKHGRHCFACVTEI